LRLRLPAALALLGCSLMSAQPTTPVIIDTDCGHDDLTAIAFLLARRDVRIEAVTIANGLAHVRAGAANVARLALGGRGDVPVFIGREAPLRGHAAFPDPWREKSDALLSGLKVPAAGRAPEKQSAADYLAGRLRDHGRPARVLALGPLTNFGEALEREPEMLRGVEMVIMGGAIRVPGNLGDGGAFKTNNTTAEWNIFVDPPAAKRVFASGARIQLVPLDATNHVPIDKSFFNEFRSKARTPLGEFVAGIMERDRRLIEQGTYYAWDAVAGVALLEPVVLQEIPMAIEVKQSPPEEGRTTEMSAGRPHANVALGADAAAFRKVFMGAFRVARPARAGSTAATP
jgi:pyrimidine-specific ribonucleoside hydrolase